MLTGKRTIFACAIAIFALMVSPGLTAELHVDRNDPTAFRSIQEAIDAARTYDTVVVHRSVYSENIDFHGKAITVRSLDPNDPNTVAATIVDGVNDRAVVSFQSGETPHSVLAGITITQGPRGGITLKTGNERPRIVRCIVTSNYNGSGINGGSPTIIGCTITENYYSGIAQCQGEIRDCTIQSNKEHGIYGCRGEIHNCVVSANVNAGIQACTGHIVGCTVSGNGSYGIRVTDRTDRTTIENCLITGNRNTGIFDEGATPVTVKNCTIAGNDSDGVYRDSGIGSLTLAGCIVALNHRYGLHLNGAAHSSYNDIWGNRDGPYGGIGSASEQGREHDMQEPPLFIDNGYWDTDGIWHQGDYHLLSTVGRWDPVAQAWVKDEYDSPCLDRGDPNTPFLDEPYPNGGRVNMGAYGGTPEASMSVGGVKCVEYPVMDFNHDCKVDQADLDLFMQHWLECGLDPNDACWPDGPPAAPVVQP